MNEAKNEYSRTTLLAAKVIYAALKILKDAGGQLPGQDLLTKLQNQLKFDAWALERYPKSGHIRWQTFLQAFSIDCIKAGFIQKKKGVWFLTKEGELSLSLGDIELLKTAHRAYNDWKSKRSDILIGKEAEREDSIEQSTENPEIKLDEVERLAADGIKKRINDLNPYAFQDLVAALLRGMGYYTPFVAPKGKDGGIDIIAYRDPLGTSTPRIKVQVKHKVHETAAVDTVRQLMGLLQKDGDVGIFVSTGGFTSDARSTARTAHVHIELIDFERFISLWQEFYPKLADEDKTLLPLRPVYLLAPEE